MRRHVFDLDGNLLYSEDMESDDPVAEAADDTSAATEATADSVVDTLLEVLTDEQVDELRRRLAVTPPLPAAPRNPLAR